MNKTIIILSCLLILAGCNKGQNKTKRIAIAEVGKGILYYDEVPKLVQKGINDADSAVLYKSYINKWAKKQLLLQKAEDNLSPDMKEEIARQLEETRTNLVIYQYQQKMILQKLDTVLTESELENYYAANGNSFVLTSNIVKALFIKLPLESPDLKKIRVLARSNDHNDLQKLESYCYQFAEKFDDFNEAWIPMDKITIELNQKIENEENFLKRSTFYETSDSASVYLISFRDFRLRSSIAPFEYVKNDIKRIIWNTRRFEFIQSLENGIYNDALKDNSVKIF